MIKPMLTILVLLAAGGTYGYISAVQNTNPNPVVSAAEGTPPALLRAGRAWWPSPRWLPAHLVCTVPRWEIHPNNPRNLKGIPERIEVVGYGLENRMDPDGNARWQGWGYSSQIKRQNYRYASTAVGAGFGLVLALFVIFAAGWVQRRPPRQEPAEKPGEEKPRAPYRTWP